MPSTTTLQVSDGCSWFPDLWFVECCIAHDLGSGDIAFLSCIAEESSFLGPFAFLLAGLIVFGMVLGRPVYHFVTKLKEKQE